jgi:hypothetical protein
VTSPAPPRSDLGLALAGLAAGALFFLSLGRLWPLAAMDLNVPRRELEARARSFLEGRGFDLEGYRSVAVLGIDRPALDYVERAFGLAQAQQWIETGLSLVGYRVHFKRHGVTTTYVVDLHPSRGEVGWRRSVEEDEPGARLSVEEARQLAAHAIRHGLGMSLEGWQEKGASSTALPERADHHFSYEREISAEPELRQRLVVTIAGDVASVRETLVVPGPAARLARAEEAPGRVLEAVGFALLALAATGAFFVFLSRLRSGTVALGRALVWPAVAFVCLLGTYALETASLFLGWEPLWPRWVSTLQLLVYQGIGELWMVLALLAVIAAGDALDREQGWGRGDALWALARGRLADAGVGGASVRGFLIGLICGAVLVVGELALEHVAGARVSVQPRGFFFYPLNSASPSAITLLFFLNVALLEELGYRFFGGTWLLWLTGRRAVAIAVPAIVYGLTHTRLDFLPPAEPFWGRAVLLGVVGVVWGWAFLRYGALAVVLSHYTADLFIFNWPRLASGRVGPTVAAVLTALVPVVPGIVWLGARLRGRRYERESAPA